MPGKHAPPSPWSFYLSLARAAGGLVAVVLLVVVLAVVAFGGRGDGDKEKALTSPTPSASIEPSPTRTPSPTPSLAPTIRPPASVNVKVLNGNGRSGLASRTGDRIEATGWNVVSTTNAGRPQKISTIYYQPGFEMEALALQRAFPAFTQVKPANDAPSEITVDQNLVCVLGADWPRE